MKKLICLFTIMFVATFSNAQTPQGINYQAVARNAAGNILGNTNICVQSTITNGNGGTVLYQETFNVTTNQFGLFTLNIGNGTVVSGTFATINWGAVTPWQKMEIKINCTGAYVLMGSAQLLSVPYALNAATSADNKWTQTGNDVSNTNTGNVGIGVATPPANLKLNVSGRFAPDWGNNADASYRFGDGTENTGLSSPNPNEIAVVTNGSESVRVNGIGRVGIGTSNPQAKLDVNGNVRINDGTQGDGKVLTSDGFGSASWQDLPGKQVAFKAQRLASDVNFNSNTQLICDSIFFNNGGGYNNATGIFTAPSDGFYFFHTQVMCWSTTNPHQYGINLRSPSHIYEGTWANTEGSLYPTVHTSGFFFLNTGDQVLVEVEENTSGDANIRAYLGRTFFCGYRIY